MVPGQIGILLGAIVSALVLLVMGVISFQSSQKERRLAARRKAREEAHRQMEEQEENAFDQINFDFSSEEDSSFVPESNFVVKGEVPEEEPEQSETAPRSTRNDFDFKF